MKRICLINMLLIIFIIACTGGQEQIKRQRQSKAKRELAGEYIGQNKYSLALNELRNAEKLYADDPVLQNDLGFVYIQKNQFDLAVEHFKKALELKPDFSSAKNNLGVAYLKKKEWDKAIATFKELTENLVYTTPQKPLVNLGLAYFNKKEYRLSEKYYNEALTFYREGLNKDTDYIRAIIGLSHTYMETGHASKAVTLIKQGLKDAPKMLPLHFNIGKAYELLLDYKNAYRAYNKVLELAPDSDLAKEAKTAVEKLDNLQKK